MTLFENSEPPDDGSLPVEWLEHPAIKELIARLGGLEQKLTKFESTLKEIDVKHSSAQKEYDSWEEEVRQEMARRRRLVAELGHEKLQVKSQLLQAKQMQQEMKLQLNSTVQGLEAQTRLAVAEERWQRIMDENEWLWKESIRPFQMTATKFMSSAFDGGLHGVLNADQMGLGKTLMATATLDLVQSDDEYEEKMGTRVGISPGSPEQYSVLWLCPNSIKVTTRAEVAKWSPSRRVAVLDGLPGVRENMVDLAYSNGLTLIANYEALRTTPSLMEKEWSIVVLDEAHKFKNEDTQNFKNVETICQNAGLVYPMTGTPITNRPDEFWAILHMLTLKGKYEGRFNSKWRFINEYCYQFGNQIEFAGGGYDRLIKNVKNMVIRRRKDEVDIELPDKVRETRFLEMPVKQRELYNQMRDYFYLWLDKEAGDSLNATNVLAHLTRLRQLALYPAGVKIEKPDGTTVVLDCEESAKLDEAMEIIDELIANDEKCLVFSNYNEPLYALQRRIENKFTVETAAIVGGVSPQKRSDIVDRFNDGESKLRVVVGNIAAMGLGLNLQGACSHAIFLDLHWTPGGNHQAEDRLHRTGQKSSVTIHVLQCEDSVDAFIAAKLEQKENMISGIMERQELRKALDEGLI